MSSIPRASKSSATLPLAAAPRIRSAAETAVSAAAERTSASAWASACAIFASAIFVRRTTKSSIRVLASAARRSASALAPARIEAGSASALPSFRLNSGENRLRLLPEPHGFVELGLDARLAAIDAVDHPAMGAEVNQQAEKKDKAEGNKIFRFKHKATLGLVDVAQRGAHVLLTWRCSNQPLDNSRRGLCGDAADIAHCGRARRRNGPVR